MELYLISDGSFNEYPDLTAHAIAPVIVFVKDPVRELPDLTAWFEAKHGLEPGEAVFNRMQGAGWIPGHGQTD